MPTILDMLDIKINNSFEKLDGESLMPLINGEFNYLKNLLFLKQVTH